MKSKLFLFAILLLTAFAIYQIWFTDDNSLSVLVFSKTEGYRHESIAAGKKALATLAQEHDFQIDTTEDATVFAEKHLKKYKVVVFLNTTGDILNEAQQLEFNRFIQAGGGFVGIHSAADTEYDWPWYGDLVGAYFKSHPNDPNVREATSNVVDNTHDCTQHLPEKWTRMDEWYNYKDIRDHIKVLLNLDENTYEGGENGENHPITWYHEFDGGRAWYTGMGHTNETFTEPDFLTMLWGGIKWAAGDFQPVDYHKSTVAPEENRFEKVVLDRFLNEPMELDQLPDGRILYIERHGKVKLYSPERDTIEIINEIPIFSHLEDGLLGMAVDPNFEQTNWIYLYYSPLNVEYNLLSRFEFTEGKLAMESEKKILEVATQRDTCCHSGGSVEFGPNGDLYLSTGDNTNPFESDGYAPIDERKGRKYFDAQRTSSNTNDLRGKILRIHPEADGTYSIPDGNLFPKDGSRGHPEIYAMGCRNPFRMHIDPHTGFVYWGEVGPDAGKDSLRYGPKGHDEINQARTAGYFGWPFFVGNNKAYFARNFRTDEVSNVPFDSKNPKNTSKNNTGSIELPPANPAYIWYPYGESEEFPEVGEGGRNAMAGPVFYHDDFPENDARYPEYYDKKFFIYDWMRGWIMTVTQDENGDFERMERFLPNTDFAKPIDLIFGKNGDIYLLQYGTQWNAANEDAELIHLKYNKGNRPPKIVIDTPQKAGAAPFWTSFSASKTVDYDGDEMKFKWYAEDDRILSIDETFNYEFEEAGKHQVRFVAEDAQGAISEETIEVLVGNEPPQLAWSFTGNRTFFFDDTSIDYAVDVTDQEDNPIDENRAIVSIDFLEKGYDMNQISLGHQASVVASQFIVGQQLVEQSDCRVCHAVDKKIAGPSYQDIAKKYQSQPEMRPVLAQRIIKGGQGVWGEQLMSAHPQLSQNEAELMVKYILSLADDANIKKGLPLAGSYAFDQHQAGTTEGNYIFNASYTDGGGGEIQPLSAHETVVLRSAILQAKNYDTGVEVDVMSIKAGDFPGITKDISPVIGKDGSYVVFRNLDLTTIAALEVYAGATSAFLQGGVLDFRLDRVNGKPYAKLPLEATVLPQTEPYLIATKPVKDIHDLYVVFKAANKDDAKPVAALLSLKFLQDLEE